MSDCGICKKPKIATDLRCDCRLEWQIIKSFNQGEKIQSLTTQRDQLNEKLKEMTDYYGVMGLFHKKEIIDPENPGYLAREIEQQRKEIMGEEK